MTIKEILTPTEKVEVADVDLEIAKLRAQQVALEEAFVPISDKHCADHRALSVQIETLQAEKLAVQTVEIEEPKEIVKP